MKQTGDGTHCANTWYFANPSIGSKNVCFVLHVLINEHWQTQIDHLLSFGTGKAVCSCPWLFIDRQVSHSVLTVAAYWLG